MVKLISDIIGSKLLLFQERVLLGEITGCIIDPKDGAFLGLKIIDSIEKSPKVIPLNEIKGFGPDFVMIKDMKSLSEPSDVVRIEKALKIDPRIIGEKVETECGQKLGKVEDATIDIKFSSLGRLYVRPKGIFSFFAKQLIIPAKKIVEIKKNLIIVSDEFAKVEAKKVTKAVLVPTPE